MEAATKIIPLVKMRSGEHGQVVEIQGGHRARERLQALGIREGKKLTKISAQFLRGPITVKVGRTVLAVGYGMATKVMVECCLKGNV